MFVESGDFQTSFCSTTSASPAILAARRASICGSATRSCTRYTVARSYRAGGNAASPSSKKFRTARSFRSSSPAWSSIQKPRPGDRGTNIFCSWDGHYFWLTGLAYFLPCNIQAIAQGIATGARPSATNKTKSSLSHLPPLSTCIPIAQATTQATDKRVLRLFSVISLPPV